MRICELCKPDLIEERLENINLDALWAQGIRGLILDMDNTLCPWRSLEISPERKEWIARARQRFKLCILSNTVKFRRLRAVGKALDIPVLARWGLGRKPFKGGIQAALKLLGTKPHETALIGDQLFADVLGGNRQGLYTIWIPRLEKREFISTRLMRGLERWMLRRLGLGKYAQNY